MFIKIFEDENEETPELKELFDKINKESFQNSVKDIPVEWYSEDNYDAGRCKYDRESLVPTSIGLNHNMFSLLDYNKDKIKYALQHEMTHAFLLQEKGLKGHPPVFNQIMNLVTGIEMDHTKHDFLNDTVVKIFTHYVLNCNTCGDIGHFKKLPLLTPSSRLVCRCGDSAKFVKNNLL